MSHNSSFSKQLIKIECGSWPTDPNLGQIRLASVLRLIDGDQINDLDTI